MNSARPRAHRQSPVAWKLWTRPNSRWASPSPSGHVAQRSARRIGESRADRRHSSIKRDADAASRTRTTASTHEGILDGMAILEILDRWPPDLMVPNVLTTSPSPCESSERDSGVDPILFRCVTPRCSEASWALGRFPQLKVPQHHGIGTPLRILVLHKVEMSTVNP